MSAKLKLLRWAEAVARSGTASINIRAVNTQKGEYNNPTTGVAGWCRNYIVTVEVGEYGDNDMPCTMEKLK